VVRVVVVVDMNGPMVAVLVAQQFHQHRDLLVD
jgi:hypothetical protein